jgi:hypothetical protein
MVNRGVELLKNAEDNLSTLILYVIIECVNCYAASTLGRLWATNLHGLIEAPRADPLRAWCVSWSSPRPSLAG